MFRVHGAEDTSYILKFQELYTYIFETTNTSCLPFEALAY